MTNNISQDRIENAGDATQRVNLDLDNPHWDDFAEAALQADDELRGDGWQPIESAPKDGTQVLLWRLGAKVAYIGKYRDYYPSPYPPTHRHPLPPAPESEA